MMEMIIIIMIIIIIIMASNNFLFPHTWSCTQDRNTKKSLGACKKNKKKKT